MKVSSKIGYDIFSGTLDQIDLGTRKIVHTINQYSYCMALEDAGFREALQCADVLLPDGVGITGAVGMVDGESIKKIAGADLHRFLLQKANAEGLRVFYMGSSDQVLGKIRAKLKLEYPEIQVGFYSPPFKPQFSDEDNAAIIEQINQFKPDILFVGMTAPKQEKWVEQHKLQINATCIGTIGAVFDFYAENIKRAHPVFIKLGLEWAVRLISEPRRMWRRYMYYGPVFLWKIIRVKLS
ncbi:MAG: WecB/TagA/CpsF family glycosyltransferase [Bacteroidota bacterium]